jgi:hypothetical protein
MTTPFVSVDFPGNGCHFDTPPFASGLCGYDVLVSGKLTREAHGNHPRKEVQGLLLSCCPVGCDGKLKYWLLVFPDFEPDPKGKYMLTVSDEWTGEVLAAVFDISVAGKYDPNIMAPTAAQCPLSRGFTVQVNSSFQTPDPSLSIDNHLATSTFTKQAGPFQQGDAYIWYYSAQVSGWDKTPATLLADQGGGHTGTSSNLTFQSGV